MTPVMYTDPSEEFAITLAAIGFIIGAIAGATAGGFIAYNVAKDHGAEGWDLIGWTVVGTLGGGIIGGAIGAGIGALITNVTGIYGLSITKYYILPIKQVTILGHYGYVATASSVGAGSYHISTKIYNSLSASQRMANNIQYMKDAIKLGSKFEIVATKVINTSQMLFYEIQYLIEQGIQWVSGL